MASESKSVICFFNSCKAWGGGEKWHLEMASRLFAEGYRVMVCASPKGRLFQRAMSAGIPVFPFEIGNLSFLNIFLRKRIEKFFRKNQVEHVILNLPSDLKCAGVAAKNAGVPDIVYRRGSAIAIKNSRYNRLLFKNIVHRVIANSEETKRTILAHNNRLIAAEKIFVIHNGIDLQRFDAQEVDLKAHSEKSVVIGNLGRLEPQKNQMFLLRVLQLVRKQGVNAVLRIGGAGRLEADLRAEVQRLGLSKYVELTGFVDDVKSFMAQLDIFALSSLWEGFGYVLVEAQALSKPVVAFRVSSNPEVVTDGGILVPTGDERAFADAIVYLSSHQKEAQQMGNAGRRFVASHFDIDRTTQKLIGFIEQ